MTKILLAVALLLCTSAFSMAQSAKVIHYPELEKLMSVQNDTTYVINFWASWCKPCVAEFANFQRIAKDFLESKVRVLFISLDFKKSLKTAVDPFLKKHHVTQAAYLLDETDYNSWIDKVDTSWQGNIPATLIFNNALRRRSFYAQEFDSVGLRNKVSEFLSPPIKQP